MKTPFTLIIGPCVLESESLVLEIAHFLKESMGRLQRKDLDLKVYFKGSFDKANRTNINSFRGPGLEKGLQILERVKREFAFPVLTDFHTPDQAASVASVCDVIQVPAFLCRQTDMIISGAEACSKFSRILNVKKGQFLAPEDTKNIVEKAASVLPKSQICLTERGVSFGYNNLIVDMASFQIMKAYGVSTIYDATHSVQRPGGLGHQTGGKREQIKVLSYAAVAAGADGLFMEVHPQPEKAMSDASTSLPLSGVESFLSNVFDFRLLAFKGLSS